MSQNSQEKPCNGILFLATLQNPAIESYFSITKYWIPSQVFFLWILRNFSEQLFKEHQWATAFSLDISKDGGRKAGMSCLA